MKENIDDFDFFQSLNGKYLQILKNTVEKVDEMMHTRYYTRSEVAQQIGKTSQMVSVYIAKKWIKPIVFKRPYLFRQKDIDLLIARIEQEENGRYLAK